MIQSDCFCLSMLTGVQQLFALSSQFTLKMNLQHITANKKGVANTGIEPATLALLAPRSNQLS